MKRFSRLFWMQAGVLGLVALGHSFAEYTSLYYVFPRFDVPMHLLGGAWAALLAYWFAHDMLGYRERGGRLYFFLIATVLFVGLVWEVFELFVHVIAIVDVDMYDSVKDLIMDVLGGVIVSILIARRLL